MELQISAVSWMGWLLEGKVNAKCARWWESKWSLVSGFGTLSCAHEHMDRRRLRIRGLTWLIGTFGPLIYSVTQDPVAILWNNEQYNAGLKPLLLSANCGCRYWHHLNGETHDDQEEQSKCSSSKLINFTRGNSNIFMLCYRVFGYWD